MVPLAQLKQNLEFNRSLGGIVDVLKVSAAVQLRRLQGGVHFYEPFAQQLREAARLLDVRGIEHPFVVARQDLPSCTVVITSDEGFAGELNTLLINAALDTRDAARSDQLVVLGERGASALEELNESFVAFPGVPEELDAAHVAALKRYLVEGYLAGRFGRVVVVYAKFVSMTSQHIEEEQVLPSRALFEAARPARPVHPCFVEPSMEQVIEGLVSLWLDVTLSALFVSSKLAELAARVMHLEGSDQELSRMQHQLGLQYVKHRHALADTSIREISTARLKVAR
ncbi:MAG: FoF1 ATP synthase subunit gamma [Candidatus Omnitrophota bacterium]|nr:FoF1 ATP synthase subunit gamma [Candidatus Omnitrophota bacterium]